MATKRYPIRNEAGAPIGSSPDATSTDVRFWTETKLADGEVVRVLAADKTLLGAVVDLLCEILIETRKTNVHLSEGSDRDPTGEE